LYNKMLVPLDGSALSEVLIDYAAKVASITGLETVMFNVLPPEEKSVLPMHQAYVDMAAERIIHNGQERMVKAWGEVGIGSPAETIKKYAKKKGIDFILMATHGRSGFSRIVLGSVADALLRESRIPVWLIRAGIPEKKVKDSSPQGKVLVLLDGSKRSEAAIPHVEALAECFGAELTEVELVSVCSFPDISSDLPSHMPMSWSKQTAAEQAHSKLSTEKYLKNIAAHLLDIGLKVKWRVLTGDPAAEIIGYAARNNYSLIVMATHVRSGFSRWAFGSITEKVLMGVTTPIFLVRSK